MNAYEIAQNKNYDPKQRKALNELERQSELLRSRIESMQRDLSFTLQYMDLGNRPYSTPVSGQDAVEAAVIQAKVMAAIDRCLELEVEDEDIKICMKGMK